MDGRPLSASGRRAPGRLLRPIVARAVLRPEAADAVDLGVAGERRPRREVVVDAVVPVYFDKGPRPIDFPAGSATEEAAEILPDSTVIGAFHNLPADVLLDPQAHIESDILVTGGNGEAKDTVMALANQIEGCRAVDAGPLRFSRFVEGITTLVIGINGRYKAHGAIKVTGIPDVKP